MNDTLTMDQVRAAQDNDIAATTAVIEATESRVVRLAEKAARRMSNGGDTYMNMRDEFEQVGRIAVWESVSRFNGDTVDSFFGFIYSTVEAALLDAVRDERNGGAGADHNAVKTFASMLEMADGDVFLAEKLAQTVPPAGQRLSADRANAARLSWQGSSSLDVPTRQSQWAESDYSFKTGGTQGGTVAEALESPYGVPDDLVTSGDISREESRVKHAVVTSILEVMGQNQRDVIRHSFGIGGVTFYGHGAAGDDEGLAEELGLTVAQVRPARSKGLKAFAKRYVKTVEASDPERAEAMALAAAKNLSAGGRK
ncbi:hypothetical protein [Streptomyces narbonensis]|uniref:hypothetical protein n=1 Tax=Streptomyces narbonensis TaxID=67333 RepID=UPI0033DD5913